MRCFLWLVSVTAFAADVNPELFIKEVQYLASPELKGRATGSPELEKAAHYIADQFRSFGAKPIEGHSYELAFPATIGAHLGRKNEAKFQEPGQSKTLQEGKDFIPLSFSSSGEVKTSVVFAGFGLTAKDYDDYQGIDATGKFVLILRHEPKENPH